MALSTTRNLLVLLRPRQWIKNGFVFGPLLFSKEFLNPQAVDASLLAFALFCIASSIVYIYNDLHDVEADRLHPVKSRTRPLATGAVTPRAAWMMLLALVLVAAMLGIAQPAVVPIVLAYLAINLLYTHWLKQLAVVDIFCIAAGFVLRVTGGAVAISVPGSYWMLITTLCLALYLAAIKRRQELITSGSTAREALVPYSLPLINRYAEMSATGALVFYSLFVLTVRPELVVTVPFVLFGLYRYWYVVEVFEKGESPTELMWEDLPLIACVLAWLLTVTLVLGGVIEGTLI